MINEEGKVPTNKGDKTPNEIVSELTYISYKTNRELGMTHEGAVRIGIGNDTYKERYERERAELLN